MIQHIKYFKIPNKKEKEALITFLKRTKEGEYAKIDERQLAYPRVKEQRAPYYDDYRKLFNEEPPHVKGIRIQTNSQHTESIGEGYVGKIVFSKNLAVAR